MIRCVLTVPETETKVARRFQALQKSGLRPVVDIIRRLIPTDGVAREGAHWKVSAEIRARNFGARWRVLCSWKESENLELRLADLHSIWTKLPKESRGSREEIELEFEDAVATLKAHRR